MNHKKIERLWNEEGLQQTSDPSIWSVGDCASVPLQDSRIRLDSVGNAIDHARRIAANIASTPAPYIPKPWIWSDQYDLKLQIAGLNTGYDDVVTRDEDAAGVSFWYFAGDRLLAVDAMNNGRDFMVGRRINEMGKTVAKQLVSDASVDLKELLASAIKSEPLTDSAMFRQRDGKRHSTFRSCREGDPKFIRRDMDILQLVA